MRLTRQRGITLLESMIAIVLVALGVLGILGVQLRTLADTQTSVRRAQAIRLIEDLSERMKANPSALAPQVIGNYEVDWGDVSGTVPNCANGCSAPNMARADVAQWKATVASTLPLGDATVFEVAAGAGANTRTQLGVMVAWRENEREREDDRAGERAAYKVPFTQDPVATGEVGASVSCPANRICHLQYLQPTLRCLPAPGGSAASPPVACP
nr:type IV pilus modification protein PilV [Variovorax boronicumulans]